MTFIRPPDKIRMKNELPAFLHIGNGKPGFIFKSHCLNMLFITSDSFIFVTLIRPVSRVCRQCVSFERGTGISFLTLHFASSHPSDFMILSNRLDNQQSEK